MDVRAVAREFPEGKSKVVDRKVVPNEPIDSAGDALGHSRGNLRKCLGVAAPPKAQLRRSSC
jgi:hypothetical protein